jgi:transcriptional regulator with XRE-family HTH domain
MITKEILGLRIKNARNKKQITQETLADLVELDSKSISNYERGQSFPSIKTLNKIAETLKYPMEYFLSVDPKLSVMARLYYIQERLDEMKEEVGELKELLKRM